MKKQTIINLIFDIVQEIKDFDYIEQLIYVFSLLFLKITLDTNKSQKEQYISKYGEEKAKRLIERQQIITKIEWKDIYKYVNYPDCATHLNIYLNELEKTNLCLKDIFIDTDFTKINYKSLANIIEKLNINEMVIDEENKQELISAIEEILTNSQFEGRFFKTNAGEDFTPLDVADLIGELLEVKENEKVADLVCGSGGLILNTIKKVENEKVKIYVQDQNQKVLEFCRLNILLHGIYDFNYNVADTINYNFIKEKFDVIVGNIPFSMQNEVKKNSLEGTSTLYNEKYPYGLPPSSKADYAFIQIMLNNLKNNGRMAVIVPLGVLSRPGAEEEIRKNMIKSNIIETIILLPSNLFKNTLIKTCIIIFNKNKTENDVLFVDSSNIYKKVKYRNKFTNTEIEEIVDIVKKRTQIESKSNLVSVKEILENKANLTVSKYIQEKNKTQNIDLQEIKNQIKNLEKQLEDVAKQKAILESKL